MIYVTGDTHGARDFVKLLSPNLSNLTKKDYVIICGDIGVLFNPEQAPYYINLYSYLPFTVLFVDGNHENFDMLNSYKVEEWNGGKVHKITDSIIHLMRGQVYEIEGKKFFTFGGGLSFDKDRRIKGESWWEEEMPTEQDYAEALKNLAICQFKVDYVISHDCPRFLMFAVANYSAKLKYNEVIISASNEYLNEISRKIKFENWYFAHYHIDKEFVDKYHCLYQKVIRIN